MKYIKKMFEWHLNDNNSIPDDEQDLVELFSQKFIEEYFDNNFEIGADEASNGVRLWDFVDIDKLRDGLIEEQSQDRNIDDKEFTNKNYRDYIEEHMLGTFKEKIPVAKPELDKFREDLNLGSITYEEILKKLSRDELINLIEDYDMEYDFKQIYFTEWWEDMHPEDILIELHGKHSVEEDLYKYLFHYVNDNDIIEDYISKIQYETKMEYVRDYICSDRGLQKKLLKINTNTVEALFEIMEDNENSIGDEYAFQKLYIKTNVEREIEEFKDDIMTHVLKQIKTKFGLNPKIEKEYKDYMYLIDAEKYNL